MRVFDETIFFKSVVDPSDSTVELIGLKFQICFLLQVKGKGKGECKKKLTLISSGRRFVFFFYLAHCFSAL